MAIIVGIVVKISESYHGLYWSYFQQQLICTQKGSVAVDLDYNSQLRQVH